MERKSKIYTIFTSVWLLLIISIGGCVVHYINQSAIRSQDMIWEYKFESNPHQTRGYKPTIEQDSIARAWQIEQGEKLLNKIR